MCYSIPFFASHKSGASIDALKIVLIEFDANGRLIASPTISFIAFHAIEIITQP